MVRGCGFVLFALVLLGGIVAAFKPKGDDARATAKQVEKVKQPESQPIKAVLNVPALLGKGRAEIDALLGKPADAFKSDLKSKAGWFFCVYRPDGPAGIDVTIHLRQGKCAEIGLMPPEKADFVGDPIALLGLAGSGIRFDEWRQPSEIYRGKLAGFGRVKVTTVGKTAARDGKYSSLHVQAE